MLDHTITSPCVYAPLQRPASQIRLLQIEAGGDSSPIICTLTRCYIDEIHGKYEALSYTWGNLEPQSLVIVDGQQLAVGRNLFAALQCLRRKDSERTVWIDAMCIDQTNVLEKNAQVPLMRQIYRVASQVVVWLGDGHDFDVKAVYDLAAAAKAAPLKENSIIDLFDRHGEGMDALKSFFLLPYWSRVWIVQELALARRCRLLCGAFEGDWEGFSKLQRMIIDGSHELDALREEFFVFGDKADVIMQALPQAIESVRPINGAVPSLNLLEVQRRFRSSECGNQRDKVYGFLGLVKPEDASEVVIDYSLTVAEVYTQAIKMILDKSGNLDFLSDCIYSAAPTRQSLILINAVVHNDFNGLHQLPSWVPNWTRAQPLGYRSLSSSASKVPFRAGGETINEEQLNSISAGWAVLNVRGILVDEIAQLDDDGFSGSAEMDSKLASRVMAVDRNMDGSAYNEYTAGKESYRHRDKPPSMMGEFVALHGRKLFVGKRGEVGLVPSEAQEGDAVCVIWGCSVALVLRRVIEGWIVIGESYLHGFMAGEALSRRKYDDEVFVLV